MGSDSELNGQVDEGLTSKLLRQAADALSAYAWVEYDYESSDTTNLSGWFLAEIMESYPAVVEYDHDIGGWRYLSTGSFCVVIRYMKVP